MKKIVDATWTREGNVIVQLSEIASWTESFGKQIPVLPSNWKHNQEYIEIEISDKSIEANDGTEKATEIIYAELEKRSIEVYKQSLNIM
jgi:hypothetical protein